MSLYRQAGGRGTRALAIALLVGLLIGGLAGYLAGRASVDEPSAAEVIAGARAKMSSVAAGLELVPIEYEGAVRNGKVAARTEYAAAKAAASRASEDLAASAEDLRAIDPAAYEAATSAIEALEAAIDGIVSPARVESLAQTASTTVESLADG
jgi:hypothetical protein